METPTGLRRKQPCKQKVEPPALATEVPRGKVLTCKVSPVFLVADALVGLHVIVVWMIIVMLSTP
jgi:hypothetical protein